MGRRTWLASGGALIGGTLLGSTALGCNGDPEPPAIGPYGGIVRDPRGVLDLLEGFSYRILERSGARMSDGHRVPSRPDGMACFDGGDGSLVLMRNHELTARAFVSFVPTPRVDESYDPNAAGGVTRLVLDARTLERRSSNVVLCGTLMNCAGGASPWGWLSCEEAVEDRHGFVFLTDIHADRVRRPERITAYGRFRHEAAAVDPATHVCYLSEDRDDSCLYRFVPNDPATPFEGRLQALAIRGQRCEATASWECRTEREIAWVDVPDPTPADDSVRAQAAARGAATFRRGEGLALADGALYLCASTGGALEAGQIFRIEDHGPGGSIEAIAVSTDRGALDMPDNVTVAPGGTIFFVEDGGGHDYLRGVRADGSVFALGRNAASEGEITGVCFSPDGRAMFANLQEDGLTVVIRGPFERLT
jgi:hypothetical protein